MLGSVGEKELPPTGGNGPREGGGTGPMIPAVTVTTAGPDWASTMTAIGTVALAAVTVGALITTIVIVRADRKRADRQLASEQARHAKEITEERAHSAAQLEEQRQRTHGAEQRGEAYAVLVTPGKSAASLTSSGGSVAASEADECPVAVVLPHRPLPTTTHAGRGFPGTRHYNR